MKFFILGFGFWIAIFIVFCYSHELIHYNIFKTQGVESKIGWGQDGSLLATYPQQDYATKDLSNADLAHTINEIIGYTVSLPILALFGIYLILKLKEC